MAGMTHFVERMLGLQEEELDCGAVSQIADALDEEPAAYIKTSCT